MLSFIQIYISFEWINESQSTSLQCVRKLRWRFCSSLLTTVVHIIHRFIRFFISYFSLDVLTKETSLKTKRHCSKQLQAFPYIIRDLSSQKFVIEIWFDWAIRKEFLLNYLWKEKTSFTREDFCKWNFNNIKFMLWTGDKHLM